jgi:hypothetical protein
MYFMGNFLDLDYEKAKSYFENAYYKVKKKN